MDLVLGQASRASPSLVLNMPPLVTSIPRCRACAVGCFLFHPPLQTPWWKGIHTCLPCNWK